MGCALAQQETPEPESQGLLSQREDMTRDLWVTSPTSEFAPLKDDPFATRMARRPRVGAPAVGFTDNDNGSQPA